MNRDYSDTTPDVSYTYDNLPNAKVRLTKVSSVLSATKYTGWDILVRRTGHRQSTNGKSLYVYDSSATVAAGVTVFGGAAKKVLKPYVDLLITIARLVNGLEILGGR